MPTMTKDSKAAEPCHGRAEPQRQGIGRATPDAQLAELAQLATRSSRHSGLPIVQRRAALASTAAPESGRAMPGALSAKMEHAFGTSFSGVRVHPDSQQAVRMGAEAFTAGEHVHFAPGRFRPESQQGHALVGHELAHVVQQRAGRVQADVQYAGVEMNVDRSLEDEADRAGQRAARGEPVDLGALPPPPPSANSSPTVQAKLGFELEMLILVDTGGRPLPEKSQIGTFGNHITLDVDQSREVDSPTTTAGSAADYDLPQSGSLTKKWYHANSKNLYDSEDAAKLAHGDGLVGVTVWYWDDVQRRYWAEADVDWTAEWFHAGTNTTYTTEIAARNAHVDLAGVRRRYRDANSTVHDNHVAGPGMGNERYASILELVTNAYAPETDAGAADIVDAMTEAKELADLLETKSYKSARTRLNSLSNKFHEVSNTIYFGHGNQNNQTTDASIQTTLGLDIAQLASFVASTMAYSPPQQQFLLKHDSDYRTEALSEYITRAHQAELPRAAANATAILNEIGKTYDTNKTSTLVNLRGLLILTCQYLRMGRYAYNGNRWVLDKNLTPMLSRTDLSDIRKNQLRDDERAWLAEHIGTLKTEIYTKTARGSGKSVYTDPTETQVYGHINLTVADFVDNVFAGDADGITANLGGFKRLDAEDIDPDGERTEANKRGPVFELRNMIPGVDGDRFPRSSWIELAEYMTKLLATLNARNDADAKKDALVTVSNLGVVTPTEKTAWQK